MHTQHIDFLSVGIDLGTSNTVCAVCDSRSKKVSVLECGDDPRNPNLLPSIVGYHKNGKRVVGSRSTDNIQEYVTGNTFYLTKRLLGRRYKEATVQDVVGNVSFAKNVGASDRKTVRFKIRASGHPKPDVVPEQVNAAIVSHVLRAVESQYDGFAVAGCSDIWKSPKTLVVVGVPANYDAAQRKATRHAVEIAGIPSSQIHLINEPTAAAIAHRDSYNTSPPEHMTLLVYDFGGGTIDVTIVEIGYNQLEWLDRCKRAFVKAGPDKTKRWKEIFKLHAEALHDSSRNYKKQVAEQLLRDAISPYDLPLKAVGVNVCAVEGNTKLGGHDFTRALVAVVLTKLRPRCRRQYPGLTDKDLDRLLFDDAFRTELTRKCETAKMELSLKPEAHVLFRLRALKQIPSTSPVSKIMKCLLEKPQSKQARLISRIFKVNSSNAQHRAINLTLRKTLDTSRGTETYTIEWSSRQLFRNGHVIDLSTIDALGLGAGRDAPDVMHVIRADPSKRAKLRNYFWVRYIETDGKKKIRCFFAEESSVAKVWMTVLQELQGSTSDRQRREEKRCSYECTSESTLHEEVISREEFEMSAANYVSPDEETDEDKKELEKRLEALRKMNGTESPISISKNPRRRPRNLWTESIGPIDEAIKSANLVPTDINEVLFIGGTTFIPKIRKMVHQRLPTIPKRRDRAFGASLVAVARGAARYGSTLCQHMMGHCDMMVTDIISCSLGLKVKAKGGKSSMLHMVRKGEFLPFAHAARFHPVHGYPHCSACHCDKPCSTIHCKNPCTQSQDMCTIVVYEGESEQCENDAHNRKIGEFNIDLCSFDPPVTDPAKVGITVEFLLDCERALTVTANAVLDDGPTDRPRNQRSHRLKTERTADLTLTENEVRRMKRLELYYKAKHRSIENGEVSLLEEFHLEDSGSSADEESEGVAFDSEDDELFRSPAITPSNMDMHLKRKSMKVAAVI